jgi:hypothetical protein
MSVLTRPVQSARREINIPDTYLKGQFFESYIREYLFPKDKYTLLEKTHSYLENKGDFVFSSKNPDFKFKSESGKTFFLEAKYRSYFFDGAIEWCKFYQLSHYREVDRIAPVYVVIGIDGQPDDPDRLFLLPLKVIKGDKLFRSTLQLYEIPAKKCVSENQLDQMVISSC